MDKVRLGRALGYGARHAAKALAQAVDAATTPDPSRARAQSAAPRADADRAKTNAKGAMGERTVHNGRAKEVARTAGRSIFAPLASFSRTLWLEVTGSFFALIAFSMGGAAWKLRGAAHLPSTSPEAHRLYLCAAIFVFFSYFAVSSFVRARRS